MVPEDTNTRWKQTLLYSNVFYAFCAVALCVETQIQLHRPLQFFPYVPSLFFGTIAFYMMAYLNTPKRTQNERQNWYRKNKEAIKIWLLICAGFSLIFALWCILGSFSHFTWVQFAGLALFPLAALLYYGDVLRIGASIRNFGFFKPFIVAFVWAGAVTIYPIAFSDQGFGYYAHEGPLLLWFFTKNLMFIASLCILFDIKDYAEDANANIKTYVVRYGLRRTLFYIVFPLTLAGWLSLMVFSYHQGFSLLRLGINTIPFVGLFLVAGQMRQKRPIFFYLFAIDGLMLLKALCGILGTFL